MAFHIYFGAPGSGKSTIAANIVRKNCKKGIVTYCNFPVKGSYLYNVDSDFGFYDMSDCDIIVDEASICWNSRKFKSFKSEVIAFLKLYRHYGVHNIYLFSQDWEDMDITARRLADRFFHVRKSILPWFVTYKRLSVRLDIDELKHEPTRFYEYVPLSKRYVFAPRCWKLFDSWECPDLPSKSFPLIGYSPSPVQGEESARSS